MIDGNFLLGKPKSFKGLCNVYPPTINDIYSTSDFYTYTNLLLLEQEDLNEKYKDQQHVPTPFEALLINCAAMPELNCLICNAFEFFIHESVIPLYNTHAFLIGDPAEVEDGNYRLITEDIFLDFQDLIALSLGRKPVERIAKSEDMDPRLRRMKEKRKEAQRVKAKQIVNSGEAITLEQNLVAIFCMGIGITPLNIGEMTYASVINIIQGYQVKESYDTTIRAMTSGFGSKKTKTPKYWMTQI